MATYRDAGVNIDLADQLVELIKPHAARTHTRWHKETQILGGIGGHAAVMRACGVIIGKSMDGVGKKVRIAAFLNKLETIGQDLVAMCANDLCATMEPEEAFLTDYYAVRKLSLESGERVIAGIADACRKCGIALVGGETAEEPSARDRDSEFELVGDIVGITRDEDAVSNPKRDIKPGMKVWGFPSNGLHSNGYSLVHEVFGIRYDDPEGTLHKLNTHYPELGCTLGEELMRPTTLYPYLISAIRYRLGSCIGGFAHVTGGGIIRNIRRILPPDCTAVVDMARMKRRPIFDLIERVGDVKWLEMHRTFNCGVGLICVSIADLDSWGFVHIGDIKPGNFGERGIVLYSS